jgi:acetylglutamate kinase
MEKVMQLNIIKIGGNVIDNEEELKQFLARFASLQGYKILVHGGGKIASELGLKLNISPQYVQGRRITDSATLQLVSMVYGGLINKDLVVKLQLLGCNAMGLSGADGALIRAKKRAVAEVDFGFVGDLNTDSVNSSLLFNLLQMGIVPVIAPLSLGEETLLNTNADTIAQELAKAMSANFKVQLIYCFDKRGVLRDIKDEHSVIPTIDHANYLLLKEQGLIADGMIPKLDNAFQAINQGVSKVILGHADAIVELLNGNSGTCIS